MKTRQRSLTLSILLAVVMLAACAPASSGTPTAGTRAWVDQPATNALLPLATFTIRGHASRTGGGIAKLTFLVNSTEVGAVGPDPSTVIVAGEMDWTPPAPGIYNIQVEALGIDGITLSEAAHVCVSAFATEPIAGFVGECGGSQRPAIPVLPVLPLQSGLPTATATLPSSAGKGTAKEKLNCHLGPGVDFTVVSYVAKGDGVEVIGKSTDGLWLLVIPINGLGECWALASLLDFTFDTAALPVFVGPPTPTPTMIMPTDTPIPLFDCAGAYGTNQKMCMADPRCNWNGKSCVNL